MRSDRRNGVKVARLAVGLLALAVHADARAVFDARRNIDLDGLKASVAVELEGHLRATGGLLERQCHRMLDIRAALRGRSAAGAAADTTAHARAGSSAAATAAEKLFEDVAEP